MACCAERARRGFAGGLSSAWACAAPASLCALDGLDELLAQAERSVPARFNLVLEDIVEFSRAKFKELAESQLHGRHSSSSS